MHKFYRILLQCRDFDFSVEIYRILLQCRDVTEFHYSAEIFYNIVTTQRFYRILLQSKDFVEFHYSAEDL